MVANWDEWTSTLQDEVTKIPNLQAAEQQQGTGSESLLLIVVDRSERIGSLVLVAAADDRPSTLTVIPSTLFDLLPGYGDFALADAYSFEGAELAQITVANALGVRIDRVAVVAPGQLPGTLSQSIEIDLAEAVIESGDAADFEIADAGVHPYDGLQVEELLVLQAQSSAVSWVERQAATWTALLGYMEMDPGAAARLLGEGSASATLNRVAGSDPEVSLVPVTPVAVAGDDDGFQLVQADVAIFVADRLAHLALATELRPRVEVLNGNGEILATRSVVQAVVAAGFHVVKTDNADNFDFAETVVIAQGRANRDAAEDAAGILGVRMVQLELAAPSGVVDVSIIVGQDIATLRS